MTNHSEDDTTRGTSTSISAALDTAMDIARRTAGATRAKLMLIITDGEPRRDALQEMDSSIPFGGRFCDPTFRFTDSPPLLTTVGGRDSRPFDPFFEPSGSMSGPEPVQTEEEYRRARAGINRWLGKPEGYLGYEGGGLLDSPLSISGDAKVILFDEFDKKDDGGQH